MFIYSQITLGEMVAYLPIPGSFFALANRILNPSIVLSSCDKSNAQGFACGWLYWFTYVSLWFPRLIPAMLWAFQLLLSLRPVSCPSGFQRTRSIPQCGYRSSLFFRSSLTCSTFEDTVKLNSGLPVSRRRLA
jgi:hypothetical protein